MLVVITSVLIGPVEISWLDIYALLDGRIESSRSLDVLIDIRLPRVLAAMAIGASLGLCGSLTQALFRNPLADPALLGITSGAALAIAVMMIFAPSSNYLIESGEFIQYWLYPVVAFFGSALMCQILLLLSKVMSLVSISSLLLCGLALNALASAMIGLCIYLANDQQLRSFTFWTLGSLSGVNWASFWILIVGLLVGLGVVIRLASQLNALAMGDAVAQHIGVNLPRIKVVTILCIALLCGLCVATSGVIGFISLIAPQIVRVLFGADHRIVLPISMLMGALLLVIADTLAKNLAAPTEMPVGIFTALIGAPYFLYLLNKKNH
ncbi:iron complex transport system permease protein [Polynucleobacter victoriensis]|uniref:Iron complex transport system permease protein n=2 Tax=Polynucleobacter victoriensis TaxID=2049319 RepID=A0A212T932_9BURK|nr:iron complex transport system permease protein [Polynucleobacter victoriensis]